MTASEKSRHHSPSDGLRFPRRWTFILICERLNHVQIAFRHSESDGYFKASAILLAPCRSTLLHSSASSPSDDTNCTAGAFVILTTVAPKTSITSRTNRSLPGSTSPIRFRSGAAGGGAVSVRWLRWPDDALELPCLSALVFAAGVLGCSATGIGTCFCGAVRRSATETDRPVSRRISASMRARFSV